MVGAPNLKPPKEGAGADDVPNENEVPLVAVASAAGEDEVPKEKETPPLDADPDGAGADDEDFNPVPKEKDGLLLALAAVSELAEVIVAGAPKLNPPVLLLLLGLLPFVVGMAGVDEPEPEDALSGLAVPHEPQTSLFLSTRPRQLGHFHVPSNCFEKNAARLFDELEAGAGDEAGELSSKLFVLTLFDGCASSGSSSFPSCSS